MRRFVRRALEATALAAGLMLLSTTAAYADDGTLPGVPDAADTVESGTDGLTGEASGGTTGGDNSTGGDGGVLSGNQVNPVVGAPVTVCGNALAVVGKAKAWCVNKGGNTKGGDNTASGDGGVLSGNQINPVIGAPVTICGNAIAVIGKAKAWCFTAGGNTKGGDNTTSGDGGVLSGNQINPVIGTPITICGNSVAIIGKAYAWCVSKGGNTKGGKNTTSGDGGVLSGNQVNPVIGVPITICGNAVAVIGGSYAWCINKGGNTKGGKNTTSGDGGVGSGNQLNPVIGAPVTICGNAVAVIGKAAAWCVVIGRDTTGGDNDTSGKGGAGSGNQVNPVVNAPVTICGNAVAVIGKAKAWCVSLPGPGTPPGPPGGNPPPGTGPGTGPGDAVGDNGDGLPVTGLPDPTALFALGMVLLLLGAAVVRLGRTPA